MILILTTTTASMTMTAVSPGLLEASAGLGLFCQLLQLEETTSPTLVTEPDDVHYVHRDHFRMMRVYLLMLFAVVVVVVVAAAVLFCDLVTVLQQTDWWCSSMEKKEILSVVVSAEGALH